jgi:hypothetical protein
LLVERVNATGSYGDGAVPAAAFTTTDSQARTQQRDELLVPPGAQGLGEHVLDGGILEFLGAQTRLR